jgi:DNA-binding NtrC family response regulator
MNASLRDPQTDGIPSCLFGGGEPVAPGAFARANGGAILLQDVDSLSAALQEELVRYLATGGSGGRGGRLVDVQVLSSTEVPLVEKVEAGTFREDLYYLLNTIYLPIPPLRERREDVEPLLEHFTEYYARRYGVGRPRLTPEWQARCQAHGWPANVRELQIAAATLVAQTAQSLR